MDEKERQVFQLLREAANKRFVPSYVATTKDDQLEAETLGAAVSHKYGYDGEEIAEFLLIALAAGLEDANWHTEAGVVFAWIKGMKEGKLFGQVITEGVELNLSGETGNEDNQGSNN